MNQQLKTVLLTILTLSVLAIAIIELSGISQTALFNKYSIGSATSADIKELNARSQLRDEVSAMPKTKISFKETHFDFGKIREGAKVRHTFTFTNTGDNPLLIADAIASCGCTVPSFSKNPVAPGEEGAIEVEFNSANRKGANHKNIVIVSNAERERVSIGFDALVE